MVCFRADGIFYLMQKTLAEQVGNLVTLALSCPTMGMGGGSLAEEAAQDRWSAKVRAEAERLRALAGGSPEAARFIDLALGLTA